MFPNPVLKVQIQCRYVLAFLSVTIIPLASMCPSLSIVWFQRLCGGVLTRTREVGSSTQFMNCVVPEECLGFQVQASPLLGMHSHRRVMAKRHFKCKIPGTTIIIETSFEEKKQEACGSALSFFVKCCGSSVRKKLSCKTSHLDSAQSQRSSLACVPLSGSMNE